MTKNLGEHFRSKMHKLKPGPDYYQLLQSAKAYVPMTPGSIKFSPRRYLEKKYQCQSEDNNVSENKDLCSKSNSRKKLEYDNVDRTAVSPTKNADVQLTEDATLIGGNASNSFGDITDIQNESESDTKKTSSEERDSYKDDDDGKDSDYEPPQLLECSSAVEKTLENFYQFLIGPDKGRKPRSVENVVGDVRRIFKIVAVDNVTALFRNDMNVLRKKYLNSYCVEKATEPGSIKKYIISIIDFVNFLIVMKVPIGIENDELVRCKLVLENWKGCYKKRDNKKGPLRREADLKMLVTVDQVNQYEESDNYKRAKKVFEELKKTPGKPISQKDFCCFL